MATIDLKLKSYDELQFEIMRLTTDNYLKQQQIEELTNNWNELEEYIKEQMKLWDRDVYLTYKEVLDKMKKIKKGSGE